MTIWCDVLPCYPPCLLIPVWQLFIHYIHMTLLRAIQFLRFRWNSLFSNDISENLLTSRCSSYHRYTRPCYRHFPYPILVSRIILHQCAIKTRSLETRDNLACLSFQFMSSFRFLRGYTHWKLLLWKTKCKNVITHFTYIFYSEL